MIPPPWGNLEHSAGFGEGLHHPCLLNWGWPSPLGELREEPKTSLWIAWSWRWGSSFPVMSWSSQASFQVSKSVSNYGWDLLAWSAASCNTRHCGLAVAPLYPVSIHFCLCVTFEYVWICLNKLKWKWCIFAKIFSKSLWRAYSNILYKHFSVGAHSLKFLVSCTKIKQILKWRNLCVKMKFRL